MPQKQKKKCDFDETCSTCSYADSCNSQEKEKHREELLSYRLSQIKYKIAVMSGKGGVGKSTVSSNLAMSLASAGYNVGLLDADLHGPNIPKMLGIENSELKGTPEGMIPIEVIPNLKVMSIAFLVADTDSPVIWRGPLKHSVIKQLLGEVDWGNLDYLIVDLPPGTGDEPLSIAQIIGAATGSVIVTTPQEVALLDSRKSVNFSRTIRIPVLGVVENMSGMTCPHCGETIDLFKVGGGEKAATALRVPFLGKIPIDPQIVLNADDGKPFVSSMPDSPAAAAFKELTDKLISMTEGVEQPTISADAKQEGASRIAVPSLFPGGPAARPSNTFELCEVFTLVDLSDGDTPRIQSIRNIEDAAQGIKSPVDLLKQNGVDEVIARGMSQRSLLVLQNQGFKVWHGTRDTIENEINAYQKSELDPMDVKHVW